MYKLETYANIKDGEILVEDVDRFNQLKKLLSEGRYLLTLSKLKPPKTIPEYRAEYFAKRDIVAEETGNTKKSVHQEAKVKFLGGASTTSLDEDGWRVFIDKFKEWAYEDYEIYL